MMSLYFVCLYSGDLVAFVSQKKEELIISHIIVFFI